MLTEKETKFLRYWEQNRAKESTVISKISRGLPMAVLFALPILLLVVAVWIYFPDWYMKISKTTPGMFITTIFAMFGVILFYSFFRMQFKWESNEQLYHEMKIKEDASNKNSDNQLNNQTNI